MKISGYNSSNWWYITSTKGAKMNPDRKHKEAALKILLDKMDVPAMRKDVASKANLRWLSRNLSANNGGHPSTESALMLVRELLKA